MFEEIFLGMLISNIVNLARRKQILKVSQLSKEEEKVTTDLLVENSMLLTNFILDEIGLGSNNPFYILERKGEYIINTCTFPDEELKIKIHMESKKLKIERKKLTT